jgi:hypothetical protein
MNSSGVICLHERDPKSGELVGPKRTVFDEATGIATEGHALLDDILKTQNEQDTLDRRSAHLKKCFLEEAELTEGNEQFENLERELFVVSRGNSTPVLYRRIDKDSNSHSRCSCGNIFKPDSAFCRKCGIKRPEKKKVLSRRRCVCGNEFKADSIYCRKCGTKRPPHRRPSIENSHAYPGLADDLLLTGGCKDSSAAGGGNYHAAPRVRPPAPPSSVLSVPAQPSGSIRPGEDANGKPVEPRVFGRQGNGLEMNTTLLWMIIIVTPPVAVLTGLDWAYSGKTGQWCINLEMTCVKTWHGLSHVASNPWVGFALFCMAFTSSLPTIVRSTLAHRNSLAATHVTDAQWRGLLEHLLHRCYSAKPAVNDVMAWHRWRQTLTDDEMELYKVWVSGLLNLRNRAGFPHSLNHQQLGPARDIESPLIDNGVDGAVSTREEGRLAADGDSTSAALREVMECARAVQGEDAVAPEAERNSAASTGERSTLATSASGIRRATERLQWLPCIKSVTPRQNDLFEELISGDLLLANSYGNYFGTTFTNHLLFFFYFGLLDQFFMAVMLFATENCNSADMWLKTTATIIFGFFLCCFIVVSIGGTWFPGTRLKRRRQQGEDMLLEKHPDLIARIRRLRPLVQALTLDRITSLPMRVVHIGLCLFAALIIAGTMIVETGGESGNGDDDDGDDGSGLLADGGGDDNNDDEGDDGEGPGFKVIGRSSRPWLWIALTIMTTVTMYCMVDVCLRWMLLGTYRRFSENLVWMEILTDLIVPSKGLHVIGWDADTHEAFSLYDIGLNLKDNYDLVAFLDLRTFILQYEMLVNYNLATTTIGFITILDFLALLALVIFVLVQGPTFFAGPIGRLLLVFTVFVTFIVLAILATVASIWGEQSQHVNMIRKIQLQKKSAGENAIVSAAIKKQIAAHEADEEKYVPQVLGIDVRPTFYYTVAGYAFSAGSLIIGKLIIS